MDHFGIENLTDCIKPCSYNYFYKTAVTIYQLYLYPFLIPYSRISLGILMVRKEAWSMDILAAKFLLVRKPWFTQGCHCWLSLVDLLVCSLGSLSLDSMNTLLRFTSL